MHSGAIIITGIYIKAPPKRVFEILTNPRKIVRWMGSQTKLGTRVDGTWRLELNGRTMVRGGCLKLRPDRKLMFMWGSARIRERLIVID